MVPVDRPPVRVQEEALRPPVPPARPPIVTARRVRRAKTEATARIAVTAPIVATAVIVAIARLARR